MKKILIFTVMVCMAIAVPAFAAPITGGNPAYLFDLTVQSGAPDTWSNATFVDTGNTISGNGTINSWQVYAGAPGSIELLIYQGTIVSGTPALTLVGFSSTETAVLGLNTFLTSILVQKGDYIGWYTPGAGVISFADGVGPTIDAWDNTGGPLTPITSTSFTGDREYAIAVSGVAVPEPSFLLMLFAGLASVVLMVGASRRKLAL